MLFPVFNIEKESYAFIASSAKKPDGIIPKLKILKKEAIVIIANK